MRNRSLSAGDIIEARCTKCRVVLNHTIVAMVGEQVVRVKCNTCGGEHKYYKAEEPKSPVGKASSLKKDLLLKKEASRQKARKEPGVDDAVQWETLLEGMEKENALAYDMNGRYKVNSLVEHPVFGLGLVKAVFKPNKMEVLFRGGKKLLRCSE